LITDRLFEEGSLVDEGQQLYQIDPAPYQATYESAVADLKKAQANVESIRTRLKRYKELVKIKAVSVQDYDDIQTSLAPAEADIAIAQAATSKARIDLDYTRVYAPISGRIGKSSVTKGALVTAGQEQSLATITLLDPIYVDMTQSSEDLMTMQAKFPDYREIPISLYVNGMKAPYPDPGKIQFHEVTVDKTTDSVPLRALFPNPDETLLPGLFVRARLSLEYPDVLLVPQYAATRQADGSLKVWRLDENNQAQSISVEANIAIDGQWIVEKGLQAGDVIVTEGLLKLKPGAAVKPVFGSDDEPASSTSEDTASGKK
jgi:membrane fusion protein (multidrug efflux system)